ncbi:hypothetical protein [Acinetobacter junii]|uniref:hypothetical protein n=1 Tax=Acinetobacter junii TaxID=40215 RepID=UPI00148F1449|nr:hypothetical protein [Acinetobacter junii]
MTNFEICHRSDQAWWQDVQGWSTGVMDTSTPEGVPARLTIRVQNARHKKTA